MRSEGDVAPGLRRCSKERAQEPGREAAGYENQERLDDVQSFRRATLCAARAGTSNEISRRHVVMITKAEVILQVYENIASLLLRGGGEGGGSAPNKWCRTCRNKRCRTTPLQNKGFRSAAKP